MNTTLLGGVFVTKFDPTPASASKYTITLVLVINIVNVVMIVNIDFPFSSLQSLSHFPGIA
jgi:hypothetical protein